MARGECLAEDTTVIYVYRLIGKVCKTCITFVESGDSHLMTHSGTLSRIRVDRNLTLVNNCIELILYRSVKNFTDVFDTETSIESIFADTYTLHVTLTGMVYTLDAVDVVMEFTLDNRLEIRLHVFACNLNNISDAVLAAQLHLIYFRSYNRDLVILDLGSIHGLNQLAAVHTGTIELNLHVTTTDDLTLECGCECNRDIDIGDLDLNITSLKRGSIEFAYVFLYDQALRYAEGLLIGDYREAKSDSACATSYDNRIQRSKSIYECRYTFHGILHQSCSVTRSYVTKDQSRTNCYRYNVDNRGYIFTKRDNTYVSAGLHASLSYLIDDAAYQSYQNTLCLIGFHQSHTFLNRRSGTKDNSNTRDITGYKGNTELTDHSICQMSVAGLFIRCSTVDVFQRLNKLSAKCGSNTGHESIVQLLISGHQRFYNIQSIFHITQVGDLGSCYTIVAGKAVCSMREAYCFVRTVCCNCIIDSFDCQIIDCIVSAENHVK